MQRDSGFQVQQLFTETERQARESAHLLTHR
jgi:hypothetical protein